jgi:nitronate monooxygenase
LEANVKTAITEMFGIEHPIIQGGMHYVGFAELAAAVSNAGGLGIITGLTQKTPELLAKEIARCHDMTDKPFGVNLTFLPSFTAPPYPEYIAAIREGGIKIVETAGRSPEQYMPALKAGGIKVIHKCTSVRHSLKAEQIGCDAVSVDGFECGGHPGEDDMPNMILLPRAAEELKIPFVASGGMADARSLVAALALGAAGMNMGTRFIATKEAPVHENVKKALVAASELDTRLVMRALRNTERVLKNKGVDRLIEIEREKGASLKISDIHEEVAGVYPKVMIDGEMDAGAWSCGMMVGLIRDVPTVKELIDRIMTDAERIIRDRLTGFLDGDSKAALTVARPLRCGGNREPNSHGRRANGRRSDRDRHRNRRVVVRDKRPRCRHHAQPPRGAQFALRLPHARPPADDQAMRRGSQRRRVADHRRGYGLLCRR